MTSIRLSNQLFKSCPAAMSNFNFSPSVTVFRRIYNFHSHFFKFKSVQRWRVHTLSGFPSFEVRPIIVRRSLDSFTLWSS
ncbi:hypothetical protein L2E82_32458 [Cichorium intybus]|uniref:Uncharacterized protein n=1 Tax=Cichorium intybus TaxID=13427 RepID=A0ACB9BG21_CICIN|nr:hypothetical protein L2E82_32458 [Cichorium intybus]